MGDTSIIYSDLCHRPPSQSKKRQKHKKSRRKDSSCCICQEPSTPLSSWKLAAVILGIICVLLLSFIGFFGTKFNQKPCHSGESPGKNTSSKEGNKTDLKYATCSDDWHQYGENCYFFLRKKNSWRDCNRFCSELNSRFLKLNSEGEMKFVKNLSKNRCNMREEMYWTSLYYDNEQRKWTWQDGTNLTLYKIFNLGFGDAINKCAQINNGRIEAENCQNRATCICKKLVGSA